VELSQFATELLCAADFGDIERIGRTLTADRIRSEFVEKKKMHRGGGSLVRLPD
jgi:hypothetical protein